jgi:hypothetical protein
MRVMLLLAAVTAMILPLQASAQTATRSFYNERGQITRSASTIGPTTTFRDRMGRYDDSAVRNGDATTYYDRTGRLLGTAQKPR